MRTVEAKVVVIGAGPGGYAAAFRAADLLGVGVVLVERDPTLGGVCLNVGCIPSKTLLHTARMIREIQETPGVRATVDLDLTEIRAHKDQVVGRLTQGLAQLARLRKVEVIRGEAHFVDAHTMEVGGDDPVQIRFQHAIIAVGSRPVRLPFLPEDPRVMDSTGALALQDIPKRLLVIGGGVIGMEMATVYAALGSAVSVVEVAPGLLPGVDRDLVAPLFKWAQGACEAVWLNTKVVGATAQTAGIQVQLEGEGPKEALLFDRVLCAVGRTPNGGLIRAEAAGIQVDNRGFISVNAQQQTNIPHIFAIGDVVGQPMLAHKSTPQGHVAAEVIAGLPHTFAPICIPNVAYTDPEVAWVGLTETEAAITGVAYEKAVFPWAASGRALSMGRAEGLTKLLFDPKTRRVIGGGMVGVHAGDLIAEVTLAIEMGCHVEDLALTIHPHPTLSESVALAAEVFEGTITDLPKRSG